MEYRPAKVTRTRENEIKSRQRKTSYEIDNPSAHIAFARGLLSDLLSREQIELAAEAKAMNE